MLNLMDFPLMSFKKGFINVNNASLEAFFIILCLIIFLSIGLAVRNSSEGILFDEVILEYLHSNANPVVFSVMRIISFIGSGYFLVPVMSIWIVDSLKKRKLYMSKLLLISSLGSWILNFILKQIFHRTRPLDFILVKQGGLSYPSGHSMVTMSMYLTIAFLLSRKYENKKSLIYTLAIVFILLMGISRMYLGVHWPTDIIGGYIGGYLFFTLYINLIKE